MNSNLRGWTALFAIAFLAVVSIFQARAAGTEAIGNKPLPPAIYQKWPDLASVGDNTNRVYQRWANGDDQLFFAGYTPGLNDALQKFASVQADAHEVVLLPGPMSVMSYKGKEFNCDWVLKVSTGLPSVMTQGKGGLTWAMNPQMIVYIKEDGDIDLAQLQIPPGIKVLETSDLRRRYTDAIQNSDVSEVRGWAALQLARLDPYSTASVAVVAKLLNDTNDWVRLNAASALTFFGKTATSTLPALRQLAATTTDDDLKDRLEKAIATIESASDVPATEARRKQSAARENISMFCKSQPGNSGK